MSKDEPVSVVRVFIACAPEDVAFRDALALHVATLEKGDGLKLWHEGHVAVGEDAHEVTEVELCVADIVVALVSAHFLASRRHCEGQLAQALRQSDERTVAIIPVIVRACDWESSRIAGLQVLPTRGRPVATWPHQDEAWTEVTKAIRAAAASLAHREQNRHGSPSDRTSQNPLLARRYTRLHNPLIPVVAAVIASLMIPIVIYWIRTTERMPETNLAASVAVPPGASPSGPSAASYRGVLLDKEKVIPRRGARVTLVGVFPACVSITDDAGLFDFGHCDTTAIARLEKKRVDLVWGKSTICFGQELLDPPAVTQIAIDDQCPLFGENRAGIFMLQPAAGPADRGLGSGLRPSACEWGLQS